MLPRDHRLHWDKQSLLWLQLDKGTALGWASEKDIQSLVKNALQDIIALLDLSGIIQIHEEIGILDIRPDIWLIATRGNQFASVLSIES